MKTSSAVTRAVTESGAGLRKSLSFLARSLRCALSLGLALLVGAGITTSRAATVLYGATGGSTSSDLYILNPTNGAVLSTVGPIGFSITGLAFHPTTGVLYGATGGASPTSPKSLVTINTTTGAGILVGSFSGGQTMGDLTFDSSGVLFGPGNPSNQLYTINLSTGAGTAVGGNMHGGYGNGLAANAADTLYLAGEGANQGLRTVDRTTGNSTIVATLSGAPLPGDAMSALAFDDAGTLFGVNLENSGGAYLVTINTSTGAVTTQGATVNRLDAIAFQNSAVPEPGRALLLVMGLTGALVRRQRKQNILRASRVSRMMPASCPPLPMTTL